MNPSSFRQVIDEKFPELDEELRTEIYTRVSGHIFETLKEKVYENNPEGLESFSKAIEAEQDNKKQSELYVTLLIEKFATLPPEQQKTIDDELKEELTRVMKEIYKAYQ